MEKIFSCVCGKTFTSSQSYNGHCSRCRVKRGDKLSPSNLINLDRESKRNCKYCEKEMTIRELGAHTINCILNPKREENIQKRCRAKRNSSSDETKRKISESRIKYLVENPDKVPYRLNHSSKESFAEKTFRILLEQNEIFGWTQEHPISIYQLDFAFIEKKIDIEIDGNTHLIEKVKEIDKRRDLYMKEKGWKVLRIKAVDLKKNPLKCLELVINILR